MNSPQQRVELLQGKRARTVASRTVETLEQRVGRLQGIRAKSMLVGQLRPVSHVLKNNNVIKLVLLIIWQLDS